MSLWTRMTGVFKPPAPTSTRQPHSRAFAAARVDRFTAGWQVTTQSINSELKSDLNALRARSRDLAKNNDYAKKFVKLVETNVVGPNGFSFQSRVQDQPGRQDKLATDAIEAAFAKWARRGSCEISGRMSFVGLQRAIVSALAKDGEYLLRKVRGKSAGNADGYTLQLLDMDRLDTNYNQTADRTQNAVIMGVEVDAYRRPVAYYLYTSHPNDGVEGGRQRERVPAADIVHDFLPENAEQLRGIPWMSAAILSLHHLAKFEESALIAARKGADTIGFFVSPDGQAPMIGGEDGAGDPITVSVAGSYDTLPEGYDFKAYDTRYPDAMLGAFTKNYLRRIASGLNVAYNGLANDLEGVNFSSIRSGVIDERDQWMTLQGWFIDSFLTPIFTDWLTMALLSGSITMPNGSALPASKLEKFAAHQWQGRRWQWVDPVKDIEASLTAIRAGLADPYTIASQMGVDLEDVISGIARANQAAEAAGLQSYSITPAPPQAQPAIDAGV